MSETQLPTIDAKTERSVVRLRQIFTTALLLLFTYGFLEARGYSPDAGRLPMVVSTAGALFALIMLLGDLRLSAGLRRGATATQIHSPTEGALSDVVPEDVQPEKEALGLACIAAGMRWFAWIAVLTALVALFGMLLASLVFVAAFLKIEAKASWRAIAISMIGIVVVLGFGSYLVGMNLPDGLFFDGRLDIDMLARTIGL